MLGFGFRLWETINAWHTFTDADTTGCLGGMDISVAIHTLIYLVQVSPSFLHHGLTIPSSVRLLLRLFDSPYINGRGLLLYALNQFCQSVESFYFIRSTGLFHFMG